MYLKQRFSLFLVFFICIFFWLLIGFFFYFDELILYKNCYIFGCKRIIFNIVIVLFQYYMIFINKGSVYNGVVGLISFFFLCVVYFEVEIKYDIWKDFCLNDVICDVIIINEDLFEFIIIQWYYKFGWSFFVVFCEKCYQVCIESWDYVDLIGYLFVGLVIRNLFLYKVIGIFFDDINVCIFLVDCIEVDFIVQFNDVMFYKFLWLVFCVNFFEKIIVELKIKIG